MIRVSRLGPRDIPQMRALNGLFGTVFEDPERYIAAPPCDDYLHGLLDNPYIFALTAEEDGAVIGGLTAYELPKLERQCSEIYIYDLAVAETQRRLGVATMLIDHLKAIARARGAWVIYVQADYGDDPAIALYTKLGTREDVMHFDIMPETGEQEATA